MDSNDPVLLLLESPCNWENASYSITSREAHYRAESLYFRGIAERTHDSRGNISLPSLSDASRSVVFPTFIIQTEMVPLSESQSATERGILSPSSRPSESQTGRAAR